MPQPLLFVAIACLAAIAAAAAAAAPDPGRDAAQPILGARWTFEGEMGRRMDANRRQWLLRAPAANPGILDMFRRRDRPLPYADITPWAGEFAGKYLISAVQADRIHRDAELHTHIAAFVKDLVASQAADGYLGPFPASERLLGRCDLWGHYHCMLGLLMWHDDTGDKDAYRAVERAAEAICRVYVDTPRRPVEAGSACFNLSSLHIMAELYRRTGSGRYLAYCNRVVEDLPKDGNWFQGGLQGTPYWRLPASGPRWEALHILQGFATMFRATGDERYRTALLNHWRSILKTDIHPSGAFTTNEGASGSIFSLGAIETCCSVAWMALSTDALRLTGDPKVADEIERTLWNQALAAQHPSGSWCTYDTPLNGLRAPAYHQISFQYRPGAPELNCCSVNSPRTLGMLPEWAVMRRDGGLALNYYGPCRVDVRLAHGRAVQLTQQTRYPADGLVVLRVEPRGVTGAFTLALRIPAWSKQTGVTLNGRPVKTPATPGTYLEISRAWKKGDTVRLRFDMTPRLQPGGGPDRAGRGAIHVGPLLLAFDAARNGIEAAQVKPVDASALALKRLPLTQTRSALHYPPMALWSLQGDGQTLTLCDFATAGADGTEYAAWLPVTRIAPAAASLLLPAADDAGRPGPILFRWAPSAGPEDTYDLVVARDAGFGQVAVERKGLREPQVMLDEGLPAGAYHWKVVTRNPWGAADSADGPRSLRVDPAAKAAFVTLGPGGLLAAGPLDGSGEPTVGVLAYAAGAAPVADRTGRAGGAVALDGTGGLRYRIAYWPMEDYSFAAWICPTRLPSSGLTQVFSAWCRGGDDPLRVSVEGMELSARMEAFGFFRTAAAKLEQGKWVHVAAVKSGPRLTLYLGGAPVGWADVPARVVSMTQDVGIGFNPLFAGGERFQGAVDDFALWARALSPEEVAALAGR